MLFEDRADAGRRLADRLTGRVREDGLVLAIPRGGVVVAAEVARRFGLELDLIIPRKIGLPHNPEIAIGAVTQDGTAILNRRLVEMLGISRTEIEAIIKDEIVEIKLRLSSYRGGEYDRDCAGRQVILVDDGAATGYTVLAGLRSIRNFRPAELILALPVAPPDTLLMLKNEADFVVCLATPQDFYSVGQFYLDFSQTGDEEVAGIMREFRRGGENKKTPTPK